MRIFGLFSLALTGCGSVKGVGVPGFEHIFRLMALACVAAVLAVSPSRASDGGAKPGVSSSIDQTLSAQRRTRITVYPRQQRLSRNARRHCEAWLVKEFRVSGPVIVPRQRCWWQ